MQQAVLKARLAVLTSIHGKEGVIKSVPSKRKLRKLHSDLEQIGQLAGQYSCNPVGELVQQVRSILDGEAHELQAAIASFG